LFSSSMPPRPPRSTRLPYTTLFRSERDDAHRPHDLVDRRQICERLNIGRLEERRLADGRINQPPPLAQLRAAPGERAVFVEAPRDRKSTRLNSSHVKISYAVFCLKK